MRISREGYYKALARSEGDTRQIEEEIERQKKELMNIIR